MTHPVVPARGIIFCAARALIGRHFGDDDVVVESGMDRQHEASGMHGRERKCVFWLVRACLHEVTFDARCDPLLQLNSFDREPARAEGGCWIRRVPETELASLMASVILGCADIVCGRYFELVHDMVGIEGESNRDRLALTHVRVHERPRVDCPPIVLRIGDAIKHPLTRPSTLHAGCFALNNRHSFAWTVPARFSSSFGAVHLIGSDYGSAYIYIRGG